MIETLDRFQGTVNINGEVVSNFRFADDIDVLASSEEELIALTDNLNKTAHKFGMELNADKCKIMTTGSKDDSHMQVDIRMDDQRIKVVDSYCYLGSYMKDECKSIRGFKTCFALKLHRMKQMRTICMKRKISTTSNIWLLRVVVV